jgi:hypothetical protein
MQSRSRCQLCELACVNVYSVLGRFSKQNILYARVQFVCTASKDLSVNLVM